MPYQSDDGVVTIDDNFARFGGKSYAINKINLVEVRQIQQLGGCFAFILFIVAAFFVLMWAISRGQDADVSNVSLAIAIFLAIIGIALKRGASKKI